MTDAARANLGFVAFFLIIVVPVFFYMKRRGDSDRRIVLSIFGLWIFWNLVHAPIHEGSHLMGGLLVGQHVKEYRLIQHFWSGDFVRAYISWRNGTRTQFMVSTLAPYLIDALVIVLGFVLSRWRNSISPFPGTLVFCLTFLRPVYDVATNYVADTVFGGTGDVGFLLYAYPRWSVHLGAWLLVMSGGAGAMLGIVKMQCARGFTSAIAG